MERRLQIDFAACILVALGCMLLPLRWLLAAILAAFFHEICHYAAAKIMGVEVRNIIIGAGGAVMEMDSMTTTEELICAAAGPGGSLFLLIFIRWWPEIGLCGLAQGIYNLLPIYPLDGGRILNCLLGKYPGIVCLVQWITVILILIGGIWGSLCINLGVFPMIMSVLMTRKAFLRKIPCKQDKLGVQ